MLGAPRTKLDLRGGTRLFRRSVASWSSTNWHLRPRPLRIGAKLVMPSLRIGFCAGHLGIIAAWQTHIFVKPLAIDLQFVHARADRFEHSGIGVECRHYARLLIICHSAARRASRRAWRRVGVRKNCGYTIERLHHNPTDKARDRPV